MVDIDRPVATMVNAPRPPTRVYGDASMQIMQAGISQLAIADTIDCSRQLVGFMLVGRVPMKASCLEALHRLSGGNTHLVYEVRWAANQAWSTRHPDKPMNNGHVDDLDDGMNWGARR